MITVKDFLAYVEETTSRAGFEPEGWQDEAGKIIPPGGRAWSGLARRGCHREGVVKRGEGERGTIRSLGGGDHPHPSQNSGQFRASL